MKKNLLLFLCLFLIANISLKSQTRTEMTLKKGWKFSRQESADFYKPNFNDSKWQSVRVPHDWAIYGPFSWDNDLQKTAITQDGQKTAMEHAGRTGGLPFVGKGFYRTTFNLDEFNKDKEVTLIFDGAMANPVVYVNGERAGEWKYGYNSFSLNVTPFVKNGTNTLAVSLENRNEQSRWYPGAGLYRNVHVVVTGKTHIPIWGTKVVTPKVNNKLATVNITTKIENPVLGENYDVQTIILDQNGGQLAEHTSSFIPNNNNEVFQTLYVENPSLWSLESPTLYKAVTKILKKDSKLVLDEYETRFGIRTIEIKANEGFFLNGEKIKFQGVCNHHDLGPLGAAVNDAAIRRQIRIMKDMGVNAIRTSHNMPAPELVRACDEMGMMLMVETFDEWKIPKVKNGYNLFWDEWAEKDLVNVIHHYRNNPSVVMWCVGNEVPEQGAAGIGPKRNYFLQEICHREDPTRPVTNGMDNPTAVVDNNFASLLDVPGFNYRPFRYQENYEKLPQQIILGSETASTVSSRGVYKFPVERKSMAKYPDHQASSYDVEHCSWSDLPEDNFIMHDDLPYCIGEFVWTGFDYLGEPTPYYTDWPSHSSLFGIVDLAGLPKDRFYLYRSHWNKKQETLHILPHWTWKGREGETTPVFVYTNYPSAELFINGKSQGIQKKDMSVKIEGTYTPEAQKSFERQKRYRLMWMNTKYEPGEVKVVAYDDSGKAVAEEAIRTSGKPYKLVLEADRQTIKADGEDLSFITVKAVDKDGNLCPLAKDLVTFKTTGNGFYRAGANGDATSLDLFHLPKMPLFSGMLTAIVQSTEKAGTIKLEATAKGLKSAVIEIKTSSIK